MYISIGNIRSSTPNTDTMYGGLPITLLPIGPKQVNKIPEYSVETQEIQALPTVPSVLTALLKPLSDTKCHKGYEMVCADGNVRLCFPKLLCSMAADMENATIHAIANNCCPACTTPTEKLGEYSDSSYPSRSH